MAKAKGLEEQLRQLAHAAENAEDAPDDSSWALWDLQGIHLPSLEWVAHAFGQNGAAPPFRATALEFIAKAIAMDTARRLVGSALYSIQSPIEEQFLYALIIQGWLDNLMVDVGEPPVRLPFGDSHDSLSIVCQAKTGRISPDFMLRIQEHHSEKYGPDRSWATAQLAIECDGHDFHEKTKEQARRDKRRDRELAHAGVPVVRFTGSEIHEDPIGKANWTLLHLRHLAWRPIVEHELRSGPAEYSWIVRSAMDPKGRNEASRYGTRNIYTQTGWTLDEWFARLGIKRPEGL